MAEGWCRRLAGPGIVVQSAGIEAHGKNPRAIAAMRDAGVDISDQESTRLTPAMIQSADLVVTVCGHADELCPALPPQVAKRHWPLSDPAKAQGADDEITAVFRASRDDIRQRVEALLAEVQ